MAMSETFKNMTRIIVISAIVGAASGTFWAALTTSHLRDYALELGRLTEPLRLEEERPRTFPSSYNDALLQLEEDALPSIATLTIARESQVVSLYEDAFAPAVVLTSDGWLLSFDQSSSSQRAVTSNGTCEAVLREHDAITGASFYRCDTQSLPVVGFGSGFDIKTGEQMFIVSSPDQVIHAEVVQVAWSETITHSSDTPSRRLILGAATSPAVGSAVFDLSSKLVGMVESVRSDGAVVVLPIDSILSGFNSLLENDELRRAALGVEVINLSTVILPEALSLKRTSGALLYGSSAVKYLSAASEAGLIAGDIIVSVDHSDVNSSRSLDERLLDYQPLDKVLLIIDRDGVELEITVTLGE
jgi:hypothetical protein